MICLTSYYLRKGLKNGIFQGVSIFPLNYIHSKTKIISVNKKKGTLRLSSIKSQPKKVVVVVVFVVIFVVVGVVVVIIGGHRNLNPLKFGQNQVIDR